MFYTPYRVAVCEFEDTGTDTLVTQVPVMSNSALVGRSILAGQYIEAAKVGYEFGPQDKLPKEISVRPSKSADVVTLLDYIHDFRQRIDQKIRDHKKSVEDAANAAPDASDRPQEPVSDGK